jgi:hypothetical protein
VISLEDRRCVLELVAIDGFEVVCAKLGDDHQRFFESLPDALAPNGLPRPSPTRRKPRRASKVVTREAGWRS